jgi:hypothetical protein
MGLGIMLAAGLVLESPAWERGTHAYIAQLVKRGGGFGSLEAVYAATAPDAFNYLFTAPYAAYRDFLYDQTHTSFMGVWSAAQTGQEKAAAMGFISHNGLWGADKTAHTGSLTLLPDEGYVITKAKILNGMLMGYADYAAIVGQVPEAGLTISHAIVEAAGDILMKNHQPLIGQALIDLAIRPSPKIPALMVQAYAGVLSTFSAGTPFPMSVAEASAFITAVEAASRQATIAWGTWMLSDDATMKVNIVDQFKSLAGALFAGYGLPLPDDAVLTALLTNALDLALSICGGDYIAEVEATARMVEQELKARL